MPPWGHCRMLHSVWCEEEIGNLWLHLCLIPLSLYNTANIREAMFTTGTQYLSRQHQPRRLETRRLPDGSFKMFKSNLKGESSHHLLRTNPVTNSTMSDFWCIIIIFHNNNLKREKLNINTVQTEKKNICVYTLIIHFPRLTGKQHVVSGLKPRDLTTAPVGFSMRLCMPSCVFFFFNVSDR